MLKVPDSVPIPVAATVNCAIATVAGALRVAGEIGNKNVVIFGMGLLGQTCAAMCREAGASAVIAIDVDDRRLAEAASFGADEFLLFQYNAISLLLRSSGINSVIMVPISFLT